MFYQSQIIPHRNPNEKNRNLNNIRLKLKLTSLVQNRQQKILKKLQERQKNQNLPVQNQQDQFNNLNGMISFKKKSSSKQFQEEKKYQSSSFQQNYKLLQKIGQGAHGIVKKCISLKNNQLYAVKIIKIDDQQIIHLKQNFANIQSLDHPHIIKYKAVYFDIKKNCFYLIMDYFPHKNLLQINIKSDEKLNLIIYQIIETLEYIHQKKICHRDIKPQNILFDQEQQNVIIIDFGISKKTFQRGTKVNMYTPTGTMEYKAPQMFEGAGYDQKIDMWALGITIYKLLTRKTPFQKVYLTDTIQAILNGQLTFHEPIWNQHKLAKDLVSRLLKSVQNRLTAREAKNHIWFQRYFSQFQQQRQFSQLQFNYKQLNIEENILLMKNKSATIKSQKSIDIKKEVQIQKWLNQQLKDIDLIK